MSYFVGSPEWGWAAWAHNRAYLDIAPQYGPKKKGVIGYIDPGSAKGAIIRDRRSKLSGDHVLPLKAVNNALKQYRICYADWYARAEAISGGYCPN